MSQSSDRWLYAWSAGYAAVGAASILVPLYAISLGAGPFVVGLIAATGAFAGVPSALLWGRLATKTGRYRPFVLLSLGASALAFGVLPLVENVWYVVLANALLIFASAAAAPVLTLLVVSGVPEAGWDGRIGFLNQQQGYGWLIGLLAGAGWSALVGGRLVDAQTAQQWFFFLSAGTTGVATVLAWRWLPGRPDVTMARFGRSTETVERLIRGSGRAFRITPFAGLRSFWAIRRLDPRAFAKRLSPELAAYLAAVFFAFTGFAVFFGPITVFLTGPLSIGSDGVFVLFLVSSALSAVGYGWAGRLSATRGPHRVQLGALGVRVVLFPAVGFVTLLALDPFAVLLPVFALVGLTWAFVAVTATTIVTRLAPPAIRGDALGAYSALGGVATGVGSLLGGWLAGSVSYRAAFGVAGGLVLVGGALALAEYRESGGHATDAEMGENSV
ncbi:MFS transporter [Halospeciosus flavus]|uniref:MFS transporter n=1 Tax=Halospeciosus flavus TaxID=3032283 RepID=A0ABD5Z2U5_9EURY|nr:MFS transporter [Halospeciosus flavus]